VSLTKPPAPLSLKPLWLVRLFGANDAHFIVGKDGIKLEHTGQGSYQILPSSLANPKVLNTGLLSSTLTLSTDKGDVESCNVSIRRPFNLPA